MVVIQCRLVDSKPTYMMPVLIQKNVFCSNKAHF